ncbi:MAG: GNAT family N-acetyltransferase [Blautia sp.]|uniref:GNAT family N-acetyltransferase n=1 Tax=Blautia sp. TaxID=1955243 RepID=UPI002E79DBA3|nr:GNAT family N-acetyltransferase [Blautia sp.]MEE1443491.1 GNAT family N-acetyltransferase [Blautia sp.]
MKIIDNKLYFQYSELPPEQMSLYYTQIRKFVKKLVFEYTDFCKWFLELFQNGAVLKEGREILLCECDYQLAGIAILKNDGNEKKICTLRVAKTFQRNGIGQNLMELSFEWLNEDKPLITIHDSKRQEFKKLFERYDFQLEEERKGYYRLFSTELVYNGVLPEKQFLLNRIEVIDLQKEIKRYILSGEKDFNMFIERWLFRQWINCKQIV